MPSAMNKNELQIHNKKIHSFRLNILKQKTMEKLQHFFWEELLLKKHQQIFNVLMLNWFSASKAHDHKRKKLDKYSINICFIAIIIIILTVPLNH